MKVLILNATGSVSGAERVMARFADRAVLKGDTVVLVSPSGPLVGEMPKAVEHRECRPLTLSGSRSLLALLRYTYALLSTSFRLFKFGVGRDIDVLLINNTLGSPLAFLFGKHCVWLLHDVLGDDLRGRLGKKAASFCRLVVPVSHAAADRLPENVTARVVLNGTPIFTDVRPPNERTGGLTIGCLAALTPWKGHKVLLEAFAMLKNPDVRLELAGSPFPGDEGYADELQEIAMKSQARDRIHFLGTVDPRETLKRWDLKVLPSVLPEALPLSVLEALSMGVPCIATGIGGSLEILQEIDGELVAPDEAQDLADAIDRMTGDPKRRKVQSDAGRDLVAAKYSLLDRTSELYSVITEAVG